MLSGVGDVRGELGDLNNDGLLDVVEFDDADDRYFLNQGNCPVDFDGNGNARANIFCVSWRRRLWPGR